MDNGHILVSEQTILNFVHYLLMIVRHMKTVRNLLKLNK